METDGRYGKADFANERVAAPEDLQHLLDDVEFLEYRRHMELTRFMPNPADLLMCLLKENACPEPKQRQPALHRQPHGVTAAREVLPCQTPESIACTTPQCSAARK